MMSTPNTQDSSAKTSRLGRCATSSMMAGRWRASSSSPTPTVTKSKSSSGVAASVNRNQQAFNGGHPMREVDHRSKYNRRVFLQGAATAVPTVAIATSAGLGLSDAWADDASTLTPATLKTLVKVARDIYPHDFLGDSYYITAIKPWDGKAAKDPAVKALLEDGVRRLDQDARDRHKVAYLQVPWEADRVVLLQGVEQTDFFKKVRSDLVVSLYNQEELWRKFGYEGSSAEHGGYIKRGFHHIH